MYIAILGRQPEISFAELSRFYDSKVNYFSRHSALIDSQQVSIDELGGCLKIGNVIARFQKNQWQVLTSLIIKTLVGRYDGINGKITLGISAYDSDLAPRDVQFIGIKIKSKLKNKGISLRLIPNQTSSLSTATSFHNKLGLSPNKKEILIVYGADENWILAESIAVQNIKSYTQRDYNRPKRDMYVGMLPPKLAQIMINLACQGSTSQLNILDPFCGTGVILQEACLKNYSVQGTDLSEKMIDYTTINLNWLDKLYNLNVKKTLYQSNAIDTKWNQPIDAVVSEIYLGQPFSAPPSPAKLKQVKSICSTILISFLKNIHYQIKAGTPVCLAIPVWRLQKSNFSLIGIEKRLLDLGYRMIDPTLNDLIYCRPDQFVGRQIILITKNS